MNEKRIIVLGGDGQVGSALCKLLGARALTPNIAQIDLSSEHIGAQLDAFSQGVAVEALINAAAYTQVDKAEHEAAQLAWQVNALAPVALANWCKQRNIPFVHYSTDYVFDGSGTHARTEDERTAPINVYGKGKAASEEGITAVGGAYLILRTSWVYSAQGNNFINTMLRLFKERNQVDVVNDQVGAPTYAPHLAQATLTALAHLQQGAPAGIYHVCGAGQVSWHGVAQAILSLASARDSGITCQLIRPIPSSDYPSPAARPLNSRLNCSKAAHYLGVVMPDWQEGLLVCINEKYEDIRLSDRRPQNNPA